MVHVYIAFWTRVKIIIYKRKEKKKERKKNVIYYFSEYITVWKGTENSF